MLNQKSMIRKSGSRFSEVIMLNQKSMIRKGGSRFSEVQSECRSGTPEMAAGFSLEFRSLESITFMISDRSDPEPA
ncbi:MAG TPA: hypothetical protein VKV77_09650 [Methylovirgula sp.]|nr:hypothetical protein [Methylovirgula sp.]